MSLLEIKNKIEEIEQEILYHSFEKNISLKKLGAIYLCLLELQKHFLNIRFQAHDKEDIEMIRFKLRESILNIRISIKEELGLNCDSEILQMKELWKVYQ